MALITYVNGRYLPHAWAAVPVDDRGYQFSDGVYEVVAFFNRIMVDGEEHLERLRRSLEQLRIPLPMPLRALESVIHEIIERSRREHGNLYLQITRGVAPRNHPFPKTVTPSLVVNAFARKTPTREALEKGVKVILHPEERWARPDIKSTGVLPNILAKQKAVEAGAFEAWFARADGVITECSHSNAWIVDAKGAIITHPESPSILSGITRNRVTALAREAQIKVEERPFTVEELKRAKEAFISNTTSGVLAVTSVDGRAVGGGKPGPVTARLRELYCEHIFHQTGYRA